VELALLHAPDDDGPLDRLLGHLDRLLGRLADDAQQLRLEDEFALLVLLASLVGLVIFPSHAGVAATAVDVPDNVPARCHITLIRFGAVDVDDGVE
jgi:hypothetical protein